MEKPSVPEQPNDQFKKSEAVERIKAQIDQEMEELRSLNAEELIPYFEQDLGYKHEEYLRFRELWQPYMPDWTSKEYEQHLLKTREKIMGAFAETTYPGRAITVIEPPDPEVRYIQKRIRGRRWQNITGDELCGIDWSYLTLPAYVYYLPAGMLNPCESDLGCSPGALFLLPPSWRFISWEPMVREYLTDEQSLRDEDWLKRVSLFNTVQKHAIAHYVRLWCYHGGGDPNSWHGFGLYWKDYV
jgi:hypothetical protein